MKTKVDIFVIERVKERRNLLGITQEELSFAINRGHSYISTYENGPNRYNISHLNAIAKVLKCSPKDFLPNEPMDSEF